MKDVYWHKWLLIDDAHLLEKENLTRRVNAARKQGEPVIRLDAPWDTDNDMFSHMNVIYDEEESIFKMWYCVMSYTGELSDGPSKLAYATSTDGIRWEKPELGMVELNGSRRNNYILPAFNVVPAIIKDPSDLPERRYKMIFATQSPETSWARFHSPLSLAYSHDGIHWECPPHVNPVIRGISDDCFCLIYDADRRRYLLYTRRVPNLPRDISLYESHDLVNWEDMGRVVVAGDDHDPPELFNLYYMAPFRYGPFFLSMLNTQWTSPVSESYDSYNRSPDHATTKMGHVNIQLACSRDGRRWQRPLDRAPVITWGEPDAFDAGGIYPAQCPVQHDGETWIYYCAQRSVHSWWAILDYWDRKNSVRDASAGGLARMGEDQWVSLDADARAGSLLTQAMGIGRFFVTADVSSGGSITAEPVTPFGEPIEGLTRAECIPVTTSGRRQEIRWKNAEASWNMNDKYRGGVCWRIHVQNAKLYSFAIPEPDPNGAVARHMANFRWCECIKHKSDNWGRLSTEPATGVPPHGGPGPERGQEKPGEQIPTF